MIANCASLTFLISSSVLVQYYLLIVAVVFHLASLRYLESVGVLAFMFIFCIAYERSLDREKIMYNAKGETLS